MRQRTIAMGGVEKILTPERCVPCREAQAERVESHSMQAAADIRAEAANVPASLRVFDDFQPVVSGALLRAMSVPLVWVTGGPYRGKTVLAGSVILGAVEAGVPARYEHASAIVDREQWTRKPLWLAVELLAIDGLFSDRSKLPPWLLDEIDHLLQRRHDEGRHTLITSTRAIRGVEVVADGDLAARLLAMAGTRGLLVLPERGGR